MNSDVQAKKSIKFEAPGQSLLTFNEIRPTKNTTPKRREFLCL
jgi:hypothetical protein